MMMDALDSINSLPISLENKIVVLHYFIYHACSIYSKKEILFSISILDGFLKLLSVPTCSVKTIEHILFDSNT